MSVEAMNMSRTLTVQEVAERLRVKPITVREYLRKGKIPGQRIGRSWLVIEADLDRILSPSFQESEARRLEAIRAHEEWRSLSPEERGRRIDAIKGKYRGCLSSVDDFMREKHEEVEEEERRWEERNRARLEQKQENDAA